nr:protein MTL1-like isoform X1 [Procambarus clarkii]
MRLLQHFLLLLLLLSLLSCSGGGVEASLSASVAVSSSSSSGSVAVSSSSSSSSSNTSSSSSSSSSSSGSVSGSVDVSSGSVSGSVDVSSSSSSSNSSGTVGASVSVGSSGSSSTSSVSKTSASSAPTTVITRATTIPTTTTRASTTTHPSTTTKTPPSTTTTTPPSSTTTHTTAATIIPTTAATPTVANSPTPLTSQTSTRTVYTITTTTGIYDTIPTATNIQPPPPPQSPPPAGDTIVTDQASWTHFEVDYTNSTHWGNLFRAQGVAIHPDNCFLIQHFPTACACRYLCMMQYRRECQAWAAVGTGDSVECRLSDRGPQITQLVQEGAAVYYFKQGSVEGRYRWEEDHLLYLALNTSRTFTAARAFCASIPGHRLAIFKTPTQLQVLAAFASQVQASSGDMVTFDLTRSSRGLVWGDGTPYTLTTLSNYPLKDNKDPSMTSFTFLQGEVRSVKDFAFMFLCQVNPLRVDW